METAPKGIWHAETLQKYSIGPGQVQNYYKIGIQ